MACKICEIRRPRRACPGVHGDICAPCCGNEREVTVDCPFDCEYLIEARRHEKLPDVSNDDFPNQDIRLTESFIVQHGTLLEWSGRLLVQSAAETAGSVDADVREAIEALVRTYRTKQSGLIYETRPNNPYAGAIQQRFEAHLAEFRRQLAEAEGMSSVRDTDVLGILVFLQRLSIQHNNGRRRGRAFLHYLTNSVSRPQPEPGVIPPGSSLVAP